MDRSMVSTAAVQHSFDRSFGLYRDLLAVLDEDGLRSRLPGLKSNTIGAQLWCVVGARESYARAIAAGAWAGFSARWTSRAIPRRSRRHSPGPSRRSPRRCGQPAAMTDAQDRLVLDLLEHEAQHHGQLIRYLYALGVEIPASWRARYALD